MEPTGRPRRLLGMAIEKRAAALGVVAAALMVAAGCGSAPVAQDPAGAADPSPTKVRPTSTAPPEAPPQLVVYGESGPVSVDSGSFCWNSGCADGPMFPLGVRPHVSGSSLPLHMGANWRAYVQVEDLDRGCTTVETRHLKADGTGHAALQPVDAAGRYLVLVFVKAPSGDDAGYAFIWTTSVDAAIPSIRSMCK